MPQLTERRKADRKRMSEELFRIVKQYDLKTATLTKEGDGDSLHKRCATVEIETHRGLRCRFEFDGESYQHDTYVNAWNTSFQTDACLSDRFPGGKPNPHHFHKCTTCCEGFAALCAHVVAVLEGDKAGWIYDAEREAASIAKNGTWQERKAKWDQYRAEWQAEREPV